MELKSNFGTSKSSLESDRSILEKLQTEIKGVFFRVIQLMLKDEEQSIPFTCIGIVIQYMQITYIIFNRQIWKVWQNEIITKQLNNIFGYVLLTPYFEMISFQGFVAMMYVCLGLLLFAMMLIFLLSYSISKSKSSFTWPIMLLRFLMSLFLQVLYMPIIDLLFSMLSCTTNQNGVLMHVLFDFECWVNIHIVHSVVAIFGVILFVILCLHFSLLYFEPRYQPLEASSKLSGRANAVFLIYQLIMVICYTFMNGRNYDYLMILIMLIGSFIIFWKIHIEQPFNNLYIQKAWSMLVALNLWGVILICFAKFLEGVLFIGTVYAWIAGLPLMIAAIIKSEKLHYDLLLLNLNKVQDPDQIVQLTNYLLKLLYKSPLNSNCSLLIDGFLEIHKATCTREDCYLKQKKMINQRQQKPLFKEGTIIERDIDLLMVMAQIYFNQIKKFPNEINLRIRYAFFLLDNMKQRQQAINELIQAETLSPSLDNDFVIFRYKKIIEEEMNAAQNETLGNLDVATEIAFQNNMRSFQNKIERATLMHMDFWSQLQEDSPDLGKMNEIGSKINQAIIQVEELWNKMQKMTQNLPKAMRLYAKFIIEVLQDKDYGESLLDKSKLLQTQNNKMKNKQSIQLISSEEIGYESQPILLVSAAQEKFAQIINLNLAACNLFGYNKSEMINRKINIFMPNLYSKFHDAYVENFLQSNDNKNINKDRLIYIKMKSNYIMPCYIYLKIIQSLDENVSLAAQFRVLKSFKPTCYLVLDNEEIIDSISSSCIPLLNLDSKQISHKKTSISEIFPNYLQQKQIFLSKTGGQILFSLATSSAVSNSQLASQEFDEGEKKGECIQFQCFTSEVFNELGDQVVGYIVKLEQQMQDISMNLEINQPHQKVLTNSMQFKFNPSKFLYQGEFVSDSNSQRVDQTILWDQNDQSSMISSVQPGADLIKSQIKSERSDDCNIQIQSKINYAEGIKIVRLFENRVQDIDDKEDMISEEDDQQGRSVFQRQQDVDNDQDGQIQDFNNIFKSRKNLSLVVNNQITPQVIKQLSWTANFIILLLVALSFSDFFVCQAQYDEIYSTLELVEFTNLRTAELHSILTSVQNLQMLNLNIFQINSTEAIIAFEKAQKTKLNNSIQLVSQLNKGLMLSNIFISDQLNELQSKDVVKMKFGEQYQNYDLMEATEQIVSKALNIRDKQLSKIIYEDDDVEFIIYNLLNDLVFQMRNSSNLYANGLTIKTSEKKETFQIILGISAGALGLGLLMLTIITLSVNKIQEEILSMFLDIPDKTVKYLYNKSENFISNLQLGEDDDVLSDLEELEKEEQEELNKTLKSKRKKKKFKNTNKEQRNYIFAFFFVILLIQAYFIFNYFMSDALLSNLAQLVPEINATSRAEGFYRFADNAQRSLYINRNITIENDDSYIKVKENIDKLYALDSSIHQEHSLNVDITNSIYSDAFKELFMLQPCTILSSYLEDLEEPDCQAFADGAIYQGMAVGMARYFENLRYIMTIYDQFWNNTKANFTLIARGFTTFKNITKNSDNISNFILNLNNFNQSKEARVIQEVYNRGTFRYLMDKMQLSIGKDIEDAKTQRLALFIVFEVLLFVIYFILWLPLVLKLTRDVWRTRSMIMMIPLRVIQKIRSIKQFIKDFLHTRELEV
ncbi:unnamed protein product [Paramecium pentaurelia]|uniref:PAS domain-containing protein n=1 Tax=Paramecium pentaurelia TaxID=43138 RepID=A0A8S1Y528_9CILI|nr:unnamed protein product [Paramecium pentaurelia]